MLTSLILTTFHRDHLLQLTLPSIHRHNLEIIIVNDGLPDDTQAIANKHGTQYIFTGYHNLKNPHWRIPGFALNIGVRQAMGDIVVLSCAEIYHVDNDLINQLAQTIAYEPMGLAIPQGKDDNGDYLRYLQKYGKHSEEIYERLPDLNTKLPFLFAMSRELYLHIGGYDEDFIGQAYDDNDFVTRLQDFGCKYISINARCVHLYHERNGPGRSRKALQFNKRLYEARRGIIVRNSGREWGVNHVSTA